MKSLSECLYLVSNQVLELIIVWLSILFVIPYEQRHQNTKAWLYVLVRATLRYRIIRICVCVCVCVCVCAHMCMSICKHILYLIYFKELVHITVEVGMSKICRRNPEKVSIAIQVWRPSFGRISLFLGAGAGAGVSSLSDFQLIGWDTPHIMWWRIYYAQSSSI
jgi:hypothetical protein